MRPSSVLCTGEYKSSGLVFLSSWVHNFPYEEDALGDFVNNNHQKGPVESDERRRRKLCRHWYRFHHCRCSSLCAVLANIHHGLVNCLQGKQKLKSRYRRKKSSSGQTCLLEHREKVVFKGKNRTNVELL